MDAVTPQLVASQADRPGGLRNVAHIIAVSSCKGGTLLPALTSLNLYEHSSDGALCMCATLPHVLGRFDAAVLALSSMAFWTAHAVVQSALAVDCIQPAC